MSKRHCVDCKEVFKLRGPNTLRCEVCAPIHFKAQRAAYDKLYKQGKRMLNQGTPAPAIAPTAPQQVVAVVGQAPPKIQSCPRCNGRSLVPEPEDKTELACWQCGYRGYLPMQPMAAQTKGPHRRKFLREEE